MATIFTDPKHQKMAERLADMRAGRIKSEVGDRVAKAAKRRQDRANIFEFGAMIFLKPHAPRKKDGARTYAYNKPEWA